MKRPLAFFCLFVILFFCIPTAIIRKNSLTDCPQFDDRSLFVCGKVETIEKRLRDNKISYVIYLKKASVDDSGKTYDLVCYPSSDEGIADLRIGSSLTLTGKGFSFSRATNPGQFDALLYYRTLGYDLGLSSAKIISSEGKGSPLRDHLYRLRLSFSEKLDLALPEEEAGIMKTMLLREKGELDPELSDLYRRNGIAHVLSISGLHVTILGLGLFRLLTRAGLRHSRAAAASSLVLFLYGLMTGFSVSSVRAVFMFAVSMGAIILKRSYDILTALPLSACLILTEEPLYLYHSGFLFSYGLVAGIALLLPLLSDDEKKKLPPLKKTFLSAPAMLIISFPVLLLTQYQIPVYSMMLNLFVLPVMSILVPLGFLLILLMYLFVPAAFLPRILIIGILGFFKALSAFFETLPFHFYTAGIPALWQFIFGIALFSVIVIFRKKLPFAARWGIALLSVFLLILRFRSGLFLTFLDVGQGDAVFLRVSSTVPVKIPGLSKEFVMLVDGGSSSEKNVGENRILPFLKYEGCGTVDAILLTHPDKDHYSGLTELMEKGKKEGITIKRLILSDIAESERTEEFLELTRLAQNNDIPVSYISDSDVIVPVTGMDRSGKTKLSCLHPPSSYVPAGTNEASVCLYLEHGDFSALLTGDIEGAGEERLVRELNTEYPDLNRITLLKAAHHGSGNSTPEELLQKIRPDFCVISCGKDNPYGHPHKELLKRLKDTETKILRTDEEGAVLMETNGKRMKIRTYCSTSSRFRSSD